MMKNIIIEYYFQKQSTKEKDIELMYVDISKFISKLLDQNKSQAFVVGLSSTIVIDSLANNFAPKEPLISKAKHERIYEISNDQTVMNFGAGTKSLSNKQFFINQLRQEIELRKVSQKTHCPIFVVMYGETDVMLFKDSWKQNVFIIFICPNPLLLIKSKSFVLNFNSFGYKHIKENLDNMNMEFGELEDSIVLPFSENKKNDFFVNGIDCGFTMNVLVHKETNLSIDQYLLLLKNDIISFKDVPMVSGHSKEECIQLLEDKKIVIELMKS